MEDAPASAPPARLGLARRLHLITLGGLALVLGLLMAGALGWSMASMPSDHLEHPAVLAAVAMGAMALFLALAFIGLRRVVAGVRGVAVAKPPEGRFEAFLRRHGWSFGLVVCGGSVLVVAFVQGPRELLLGWGSHGPFFVYGFLAYALLPVHVTLHELGHAAAGALVGLRFSQLQVGWVSLRREHGRVRLAWAPPLAGIMGFHVGVPDRFQAIGPRLALHAAAGPAVSLALALASRAGAAALGLDPEQAATVLARQGLQASVFVGLALAVLNLIPRRNPSGFLNDGARILHSLRSRGPADDALDRLQWCHALGRRPCEWGLSAQAFQAASEGAGPAREPLVLGAACIAADAGDLAFAEQLLERELAGHLPRRPGWIRFPPTGGMH